MKTTRVERHIDASTERVYHALLDPVMVQRWMVPDGMSSHVHSFEAVEGGHFHITFNYDEPTDSGKTTTQTDDPSLQGTMTITYELHEAGDGTDLVGTHEGLPDGVDAEQNEVGWRMSLDTSAAILEHRRR